MSSNVSKNEPQLAENRVTHIAKLTKFEYRTVFYEISTGLSHHILNW